MKQTALLSLLFSIGLAGAAQPLVSSAHNPSGALSGRTIAIWQSHGRYYDETDDRWKWQRCRLFGTVEDLYTRSYVVPLLTPMLENAGAYVMMPRERDLSSWEAVIDPDGSHAVHGYAETAGKQKWSTSKQPGFGAPEATLHQGDNPFEKGHVREVKAAVKAKEKESTASWSTSIPEAGEYAVYVSYQSQPKSVTDATYTVHTATGPQEFKVNQIRGGSTWVYLGTFPFEASNHSQVVVSLTNRSTTEGVVTADAVRIGGGMGTIERNGQTSEMPRWAEAARYWLQYAGMPDSVYANNGTDYKDDLFARPMWVNEMKARKVPIDLAVAIHSDAGTTPNDSTIGTLGIYYNKNKKFADGRSRKLNQQLADSIVSSVVRDIRARYDSSWARRPLRDGAYVEARVTEVPTMLLEMLSHQNLADMRYGLDPQFKFDVSRAIYKGILHYFAAQGLARYVVQPLPPSAFAIHGTHGKYTLSWQSTPDPLEPTAYPVKYIIEERRNQFWAKIGETSSTSFQVEVPKGHPYSYRIIAVNDGGQSFPSEILAAGWESNHAQTVTVVNGFTRISGPDSFRTGRLAGFGLNEWAVPSGDDYSFTGKQYDFNEADEWTHDDSPGFGASYANHELKPLHGNNFDLVLTHGKAILGAGANFISSSVQAFVADTLSVPTCVDLMLGLQKETKIDGSDCPAQFKALPTELQWRLERLAQQGVPLLISGAYVGSDLTQPYDKDFARRILGWEFRTAHATPSGGVTEVRSRFSNVFTGGKFRFGMTVDSEPYPVPSADAIYPASPLAQSIMRYSGNLAPAAVAFDAPAYNAVTLGFPFETIETDKARTTLMKQILEFLKK